MSVVTITEKLKFIKNAFGRYECDNSYTNVAVRCPFCPPSKSLHKKKLAIHLDKWVYHCWRCGARGRSIIFLLRYIGAHDLVNEFSKIDSSFEIPNDKKINSVLLPQDFELIALAKNPESVRAIDYLKSRGFNEKSLWRFRLGISSSLDYRDRVIVPSFDAKGKLNYITARRFDGKRYMKYNNSKVSRNDIIFNEVDIDWSKEIILVEGPFDMMKCPDNTIPLLGCQLNEDTLLLTKLLVHMPTVNIFLDSDASSRAWRIAGKLSSYGIKVKISILENDDPGSYDIKMNSETISNACFWSRDSALRAKISNVNT